MDHESEINIYTITKYTPECTKLHYIKRFSRGIMPLNPPNNAWHMQHPAIGMYFNTSYSLVPPP